MGDTYPSHNSNSYYRNPTLYYVGGLRPSGYWEMTFVLLGGVDFFGQLEVLDPETTGKLFLN